MPGQKYVTKDQRKLAHQIVLLKNRKYHYFNQWHKCDALISYYKQKLEELGVSSEVK